MESFPGLFIKNLYLLLTEVLTREEIKYPFVLYRMKNVLQVFGFNTE